MWHFYEKTDSDLPAKPSVQVIERMFALMDLLSHHVKKRFHSRKSERSGLHPSTAHRILGTSPLDAVDRPESGSYRLGMRLFELGNLVKGRLSIRDAAMHPMRELHRLIQQPVNLSMRQGMKSFMWSAPTANAPACRSCRPLGTCSAAPYFYRKAFLAADDPQRVGLMPHEPDWQATHATV